MCVVGAHQAFEVQSRRGGDVDDGDLSALFRLQFSAEDSCAASNVVVEIKPLKFVGQVWGEEVPDGCGQVDQAAAVFEC